jgi:hypothetical protein
MTISQEEFRAAIREVADDVTERDVPQLSLPADEPAGQHVVHRLRASKRMLAPLAAAVAVIAVIATSVILLGGSQPRPGSVAGVRIRLGPDGLPPYFVALDFARSDAEVRDTANGATVATFRPLRPFQHFFLVTGAADYWTFVLAAYNTTSAISGLPLGYFVAEFNPRTHRVTQRRLSIPSPPGYFSLAGLALSPDGRELAIADQAGGRHPRAQLTTYSLATGQVNVWKAAGLIFNGYAGLSWSSAGPLAFNRIGAGTKASGVWLLNTATGGGELFADSRLAVAGDQPAGFGQAWDGMLTTNGKQVAMPVMRAVGEVYTYEFRVFSAVTGKLLHVLLPRTSRRPNGQVPQIAWTSATGNVLVVYPPIGETTFGVLRGNQFTPIPGTGGSLTVQLAF